MTQFAAIPTVYKGVQFRSRLEARWAASFDLLNIPWQYEPFDLNGWIPDFLIDNIPTFSPYHAIGTEFGEKRPKPFLVEVKPIVVREHAPSLSEHRDVLNKIEDGLGAPRGRKGNGPTWDDFFDRLDYVPVLLGADPLAGWTFQRCVGWRWIAGHQVNDMGDFSHVFSWMPDWKKTWATAGNAVQWKAPR